jgi:hypothetical protein
LNTAASPSASASACVDLGYQLGFPILRSRSYPGDTYPGAVREY